MSNSAQFPQRHPICDDLLIRCQELLGWSKTGLLADGRGGSIRALATRLAATIGENYALSVAESQTKDDAMRFVVSHASLKARVEELEKALRPFAHTGWMTGEIEHTNRTVVAHMHPEREREIVLSSEDFKRARDLLAVLPPIPGETGR